MKLRTVLILVFAVLFSGLLIHDIVISNRNKRLQTNNTRLENNQSALLEREKHYTLLNLTQKEALNASSLKIDSISAILKIKPKTIERIIYKTIIQHDTILKPVEVEKIGVNIWKLKDADKCFTWQGIATLFKDSLSLSRTRFDYQNQVIDAFWKNRRFWIFSKWKYYQESLPTCGESFTKEILIKKK